GFPETTTSGPDGRFALDCSLLREAAQPVTVTAPGFAAKHLVVPIGVRSRCFVEIVLVPAARLEGTVRLESGAPAKGGFVWIQPASDWSDEPLEGATATPPRAIWTRMQPSVCDVDDEGRYHFDGLGPGRVHVYGRRFVRDEPDVFTRKLVQVATG